MLSFTAHALQCMRWPIGLKLAAALCRMLYFSLVYWLEFRLKLAAGRCRMLCFSAAGAELYRASAGVADQASGRPLPHATL